MFRRTVRVFILLAFAYLASSPSLRSQQTLTTATITGRVQDASGAVVPHANVFALQTASNQNYATLADGQGRFRLSFLPAGQYEIHARASGFQDSVKKVQLTVGAAFDLAMPLTVSQAMVNVQVSAAP